MNGKDEYKIDVLSRIQPAGEEDLANILDLQKKAFHGQAVIYNDFTLPSLTQTLDDLKRESREKTFYKLELNGTIAASVRCHVQEDTLHVEKLMVDPELQGRGIGTSMMRQIEALYAGRVNRYCLFTGDKSTRNLHMYRKLGYFERGRKPLNANCTLILLEKRARDF